MISTKKMSHIQQLTDCYADFCMILYRYTEKDTNKLENTQLMFYDFIYNRFHEHLSRQNFLGISVCHTKLSLLLLYVIDHKYHASDFEMDVHEFSTCWNIIWRTMFSLQHISYQIRIAFWNSKMTSKIYFKSFSFY